MRPASARDAAETPDQGGRLRLLTLADLDGRTKGAQMARRMAAELASDLGGEGELTASKSALVKRAAVLTAVLEDSEARWLVGGALDLSAYVAASGELRRLLMMLGLERTAKPVNSPPPKSLEQRAREFYATGA